MAARSSRAGVARGKGQVTVPDERAAQIEQELEAWRTRAIPDASAPLEADDVARLVRDCFTALGLDASLGPSFSVHTVHYYRRKDILDAPQGRTSAARYTVRHVWQAAGARLAGNLGLLTLAEARDQMREADESTLRLFVAQRVADARGRQAARQTSHVASPVLARPLRPATAASPAALKRPVEGRAARPAEARQHVEYGDTGVAPEVQSLAAPGSFTYPLPHAISWAAIVPLGGNALCLIPENHTALHSASSARAMIEALAAALGVTIES